MEKYSKKPKHDPIEKIEFTKAVPENIPKEVEKVIPRKGLIDRFKQRFPIFKGKKKHLDKHLSGRINDLHATAQEMVKQLKKIKQEWKQEIDGELFDFVSGVINPMIKDANRLQRKIQRKGQLTDQAKTFQQFTEWIEKATLWVNLCSKTHGHRAIEKAVINHIIQESHDKIDRDFQIVSDYQEHMLDSLTLEKEMERQIRYKVQMKVCHHIAHLDDLKKICPEGLDLKAVGEWKKKLDRLRQMYFDEALHAVDEVIEENIPKITSDEEHEHLVEIISQINYIEEELPKLIKQIEACDFSDDSEKRKLQGLIAAIEEEAHQLNLDLRLTPELIDRLQEIMDHIFNAKIMML